MKLTWHQELTGRDAGNWDEACRLLDVHPFQQRQVATARARLTGQGLWFVVGEQQGQAVFGAAVHVRRSGPWPARFAITRGPWALDESVLVEGLSALRASWPTHRQPMTLRIDPHQTLVDQRREGKLDALGYAAVSPEMHRSTIWCDLTLPGPDLWAAFRGGARKQIKQAEKELAIGFGSAADVPEYAAMHNRAALEKGYGTVDAVWLSALLQSGAAWIVLTRLDQRLVGGGVFILGSRTVHYLYGARDVSYRGPAFYGAFWRLIQAAQEQGWQRFDVGGLPDGDDGVAFFKRSFGGEVVHFGAEREFVGRPWAQVSYQALRRRLAAIRRQDRA